MKICRVIGNVTAAVKHPAFDGQKLMIVQPIDPHGQDAGSSFLAVDRVQSGPGDTVLVMSEGNGVRQLMNMGDILPIRSLVVGVVDSVDVG
ncbi:MAG: EutN/CcmL family microcompartment protein [Deltaproteobacteria bacterium]|nr:EutN/CcmL family microcompartment protein [Deltaproteobacteria bacterium]